MKRNELSLHRKEQMAASLKKLMTRKNLGRITIQELADATGATLLGEGISPDQTITGVETDSRAVQPVHILLPLPGYLRSAGLDLPAGFREAVCRPVPVPHPGGVDPESDPVFKGKPLWPCDVFTVD